MEGACDPENEGVIHTSYGCLVRGQAVCEGYAKAMKTVLDRLGIPCLTVQGVVRWSESTPQAHMWNYVCVDDAWFGVDATWDDPVDPSGSTETQGVDGFENNEYLLASDPIMNKCHVPSGIFSSVGFEFTYPTLSIEELGFNTIVADRGLTVQYNANGEYHDLAAGVYKISYNGMGYQAAKEAGYYLLGRFYQYDEEKETYVHGNWGYLDLSLYGYGDDENDIMYDSATELTMYLPHVPYVEFAVTDIAPTPYTYDANADAQTNLAALQTALTYQGDPLLFTAETGKLYNDNGDYVSAPYIETITPTTSGRLKIGNTYPVTVTYDEDLVQIDGEEVSFSVTSTGTTGAEACKIENFTWDGNRTFTFDFTPSTYFADDSIAYQIQMTGVTGKYSEKIPNSICYVASYGCVAFAYRAQGYDWNVFGKPTLLENVALDPTDWVTNDATTISEALTNQLVLVTTKASPQQESTMLEMIDQNFEENVLSSETYNINLTLCKSQVIKAGQGVRVSLGFPEGYSAADTDVTFKAYHFTKNEQGEITGVEEIDCVVTEYGLILTCDAFSPFAIVAVEANNAEETATSKTVVLSHTEGGSISGADADIFSLEEDQTQTLTIQADAGYEIDSIRIGTTLQTVSDPEQATVTLRYGDIPDATQVVDVQFVAKSVVEKETARNEVAVTPDSASSTLPEETTETTTETTMTTTTTTISTTSSATTTETTTQTAQKTEAVTGAVTTESTLTTTNPETTTASDTTCTTSATTSATTTQSQPETTATTAATHDGNLPQTGMSSFYDFITAGASASVGVGAYLVYRSMKSKSKQKDHR
jgi:LPXTG-motif cell wall-anchored protein